MHFDPSIVTVKQSSIVSQIVSSPVVRHDTTHFDSEDDYRAVCRNISHCQQQQSNSGLRSPGQSNLAYS